MIVHTIGFTQSTAENFFSRLQRANVVRVIDVRLKAVSQLSGFAKKQDLAYFLKEIADISYTHEPLLAPRDEFLKKYKKNLMSWDSYANEYLDLLDHRKVHLRLNPKLFENACLLCSESEPHHCHRRLAAEFLVNRWGAEVKISHL